MLDNHYDAIIVGARCAGAPTAMLLARRGRRVLLVDRATFPSDTVSTHVLHPRAVATLRRWGLLDRVLASGCPPVNTYSFDFGVVTISGTPRSLEGLPAYAPRRTVLDKILVDGARDGGADVREAFTVDEVTIESGAVVGITGRTADREQLRATADVVIGADGLNSGVARAVEAATYNARPPLQFSAYTYWRGLPVDGFEIFIRPDRGMAAIATNDGLTMLVVGWPTAEAAAYKADIEGNYMATLDLVPAFADRVRSATRVERFYTGTVPNHFRQSHGPGWLLVGDAGYVKDPITAQGIPDSFDDAERAAAALDRCLGDSAGLAVALADAQAQRDAHAGPIFEFTAQMATLAPPPPEMQALLAAIHTNQAAMDDFVSVVSGDLSPERFFAPDNVHDLLAVTAVN